MSKEQDYVDQCLKLVGKWFEFHRASDVPSVAAITVIDWRRPDTQNYAMRYIIDRNRVIVTGDVGDAIYAFGQPVDWKALLEFDWHYFGGNCMASETGRRYEQKVPGICAPQPNIRAIAHWSGLQMAIKQLKGII